MPDGGKMTPIPQGMLGRVVTGVRYALTGVSPSTWFGPGQPLQPMAPEDVRGRQYDYAYGSNLQYTPRSNEAISFDDLRALADNLPLLRAVIETRKDQVESMTWAIKPKLERGKKKPGKADARLEALNEFFRFPDREHTFASWLRILLEEMLVIDAATIYPRMNKGGGLYSLDIVDGSTIKRVIDADGRTPVPPNPAYQQILHGVPAGDFSRDELLYVPRNVRANRLYCFSPVEQIVLTVNIALRRDLSTLEYYTSGSLPDSFGTLPKEWTVDQIRSFQNWFDSLLSGNMAERRKLRFMPDGFKYQEAKQPPLKDQYDEWLARIICYVFSVPVTAFIGTVNRATSETMRVQASQEGLVPLQNWIKNIIDLVIWKYFGFTDLEFTWSDDDQIDPLEAAQVQDLKIKNGSLGVDEARDEDGRDPIGVGNVVFTAGGPVPLKESIEQAIENIENPPPPPAPFPSDHNGGPPIDEAGAKPKQVGDTKEVGKAAKSPFVKRAAVPYPRAATRKAVAAVSKLWAKEFARQAKDVAAAIRGTLFKAAMDERSIEDFVASLDLGMSVDQIADFSAQMADIAAQSGDLAYAQIGSDKDIFEQISERAVAWADEHAADLVSNIDEVTRESVRQAIEDGTAEGLSSSEIADNIEQIGGFSSDRAQLIADTEIAAANSNGALEGYRAARDGGANVQKAWLLGSEPCDACQENADAGPIDLDETFPSGDDAPPGHPRCECALEPVVDDDETVA
jgi:hypothetical protein